MKKMTIFLIAIVLVGLCLLCGCNENSDNKVENGSSIMEVIDYEIKINEDFSGGEMKVYNVTVKNIAGKYLDSVLANVHFYDSNNNLLNTESRIISDIAISSIETFEVIYPEWEENYEKIHHVGFSFSEYTS